MAYALERAHGGHWLPQELQARKEALRKGHMSAAHQLERLTEAYLQGVLPFAEYQRRRQELEQKQQALQTQEKQLEVQVDRQEQLAEMAQSIQAFCQWVQAGLAQATLAQKRTLVELLIDRVLVANGDVEIRYAIPTHSRSETTRFCQLRTDYFYNIVEAFHLPNDDHRTVLFIVAANGRGVGLAPINGDLLRHLAEANRFGEKAFGGPLIVVLRQEEIDGLSLLIHGPIEIIPLPFDPNIRLVHTSADPDRALAVVKSVLQLRAILHHPALDGRVIDRHRTLLHEFFDKPIAQRIREIPAHAHQNDLLRKMGPLEVDRHRGSPSLFTLSHCGDHILNHLK
jgi:hypothetical protein